MNATVVITTRNRKDELRVAVRSALEQTAGPEVLVIDDGSTDGTSEMIRGEFPAVRLDRVDKSLGLIVQRNRAAELARGDLIFSIDDDAEFSTPHVIQQTLAEFDHPRVAAVAIPFINVKKENLLHQRAPGESGIIVAGQFIGTAHAIRRDLFRRLGGYRGYLFHFGEENDFCIHLIDAGYVVRLGRADPIHHFESPRRDLRKIDLFGRRNDILFMWHNVPWPYFPVHLLATTANGVISGLRVHRLLRMLHGIARGYAAVPHEFFHRRPVSRGAYRLYRRLKRQPAPLEQITDLLPPMQD